jgi:hypothetical protein
LGFPLRQALAVEKENFLVKIHRFLEVNDFIYPPPSPTKLALVGSLLG